jgi:hypothetical protein
MSLTCESRKDPLDLGQQKVAMQQELDYKLAEKERRQTQQVTLSTCGQMTQVA